MLTRKLQRDQIFVIHLFFIYENDEECRPKNDEECRPKWVRSVLANS